MPPNEFPSELDEVAEKKRLAEEKKQLKNEKKAQKKEVKSRAKELVRQERELDKENDPKGASVFFVTLVIVVIWLAILALLVKLDVGGFGSGVLQPILKDIPVINRILPTGTVLPVTPTDDQADAYYGYTDLRAAVDYIRELEHEQDRLLSNVANLTEENAEARAQIARLKEFEDRQVAFSHIVEEWANEVVYSDKGPGPEGFQKYFEAINPTIAEQLYKQVVVENEASAEVKDYVRSFALMKPKEAAGILENLDNLDLGARILRELSAAERGAILGVMSVDIAAQYTKLLEPRP